MEHVFLAAPLAFLGFSGYLRTWLRCHCLPITMATLGLLISGVFWTGSRYLAMMSQAHQAGQPLASMASTHALFGFFLAAGALLGIAFSTLA